MADVHVDISGQIEVPSEIEQKNQLARFLRFPPELPDAKEWMNERRQKIRPWLVFIQTSNFKLPLSLPRLSTRIMKNIEYFQSNYIFVFLGLIAYCLITSPLLLFAIGGSFYAGYRLSKRHADGRKIIILKHELTLAQQYGLVSLCSMPLFYLVGAGAVMFWVIGASFFIITLHASFYNIDAVSSSDEEASFGLLQDV